MKYQLEIKQLVDYPRCRIYRSFIRNLMEDRNIRTNGGSYLFYYMTLCSYANFRTSYVCLEGISYLVFIISFSAHMRITECPDGGWKVCHILCRQVNGSARFQNYRKRFVSASITR